MKKRYGFCGDYYVSDLHEVARCHTCQFLKDPYCTSCGNKMKKPRSPDKMWVCGGCSAQAAWEDAHSR